MFDRLPKTTISDAVIASAVAEELDRQQNQIELIASENIVSASVMAAQGSVLTNKYAEGYRRDQRGGERRQNQDAAVAEWTEAHADLLNRRSHSRLSASTGSSRAAARAGRKPKTMPISVEDRNANTMVGAE